MIQALAMIWAISAVIAWEAHVDSPLAMWGRWDLITMGSLMPIYNTFVAWCYVRDKLEI